MNKLLTVREELSSEVSDQRSKRAEQLGSLGHLKIEVDGYEVLKDDETCPVCGQRVTRKHIDKEIRKVTKKIDKIESLIREIEKDEQELDERVADVISAIGEADVGMEELQSSIQKTEATLHKIKYRKEKCQSDIDAIRTQIDELKQETNPYRRELRKLKASRDELKHDLREGKDTITKLNRKKTSFEYWIKGFKQIRLMIVEDALSSLSIETNNSLMELGLDGWHVIFDVERETVSGGVSKGFNVLIKAPNSDEHVPWDAWSGGESQRLRLAGNMGLANLLSDTLGINCNIEVWDEPTHWLHETGINHLLPLLEERAYRLNKQIWLIDHRSHDYGFADVIRIEMDENGSHIIN